MVCLAVFDAVLVHLLHSVAPDTWQAPAPPPSPPSVALGRRLPPPARLYRGGGRPGGVAMGGAARQACAVGAEGVEAVKHVRAGESQACVGRRVRLA